MSGDLSKFEMESTKTPVWVPIAGVIAFLFVVVLAFIFPGEAPTIEEGEQAHESQSE